MLTDVKGRKHGYQKVSVVWVLVVGALVMAWRDRHMHRQLYN